MRRVQGWRIHLMALGGVAVVLSLGLLGMWQVAEDVRTEQPQASATVGELHGPATAGQTFVAEYPGLSRVEIRLATYARRNTGSLVFHLRAAPDAAEDLVALTFDAAEVEDNAYQIFEFPPIRDSAGRALYFYLEAPEAKPGNGITVWGATEDAYPDGEAVLRGLKGHDVQDLAFRLGYDPPLAGRASIFMDRLTANKPLVWGDRWLYVSLAVAYLALLYALLVQMVRTGSSERGEGA